MNHSKVISLSLVGLSSLLFVACSSVGENLDSPDAKDACALCSDGGKTDAYGIKRASYLAYGIVEFANQASFEALNNDVGLYSTAAQNIVDTRDANGPFRFIEQLDAIPYVGPAAFERLSGYVRSNNLVPYCGDGVVQPLVESCDDGNTDSGDGCSSECQLEENNLEFFDTNPNLIRGSEIDVEFVNPTSYYLRQRRIRTDRGRYTNPRYKYVIKRFLNDDLNGILERADGVTANNPADGIVTWHELEFLSKEPFVHALFPDERAALAQAWELFEINPSMLVSIDPVRDTNFTTNVERPGSLVVGPQPIDALGEEYTVTFQRLLQMPGLNENGDPEKVQWRDLERGLSDYAGAFTAPELDTMRNMQDLMMARATLTTRGRAEIAFERAPTGAIESITLAEFDNYKITNEIAYRVNYEVEFITDYDLDINMVQTFESGLNLHVDNTRIADRSTIYKNFSFIGLDGEKYDIDRNSSGSMVMMEHWENGQRINHRIIEIKGGAYGPVATKTSATSLTLIKPYPNLGNVIGFTESTPFYAGYATTMQNGHDLRERKTHEGLTRLSDRRLPEFDYQHRLRYKRRYKLESGNQYVKSFIPYAFAEEYMDFRAKTRLPMGRYEEFEGVVIDVHPSGAIFAYIEDCELPMAFLGNREYISETCESTDQYVRIYTPNRSTPVLEIYNASRSRLQHSATIWSLNNTEGELRRDRTGITYH